MDYQTQTIEAYLEQTASETVLPAGGTAAAITGAIGASLVEMTAIHTISADGSEKVLPELTKARTSVEADRQRLLDLANADARIVDESFGGSDPITAETWETMTGVPLSIAEVGAGIMEDSIPVFERGNPNAIPDGVTGIMLLRTAIRATLETARRNLAHIDDPEVLDRLRTRLEGTRDATETSYRTITRIVDIRE
ncbi:MAG: cyclodeaminase/cyclohydrolase family protein [Halodesulfurarchaeum sp.]